VPHFLASRLREYGYSARLIDAAHEINAHMPVFVLQRIADALNQSSKAINGSRLLLLGLAYKANVHDTRESPSLEIMRQLIARGADVHYCDPYVSHLELDEVEHHSVEFTAEEMDAADCVVLLTAHRDFLEEPLWEHARLIVDTRNAVPGGPGVHRI
jgi:UDP-N-acetyl-D-glucosamine dehydrogenase